MNVNSKRALAHAFFASFIAAAIPVYAADKGDASSGKSADAAKSGDAAMMSKEKVKRAFHRMMDKMEDNKTESASDKQGRWDKTVENFLEELMNDNPGGWQRNDK